MRTSDFDYSVPGERIAQTPAHPRDASRLLVLDRRTGAITHRESFRAVADVLAPGDLLVLNDSRVMPARVHGRRADTGGAVELLLLHRRAPGVWRCLGRPGRGLRAGERIVLEGNGVALEARVLEADAGGQRTVRVEDEAALERAGTTPLPPYIRAPLEDPERYQTVYARVLGSAAAPTAGLHFTPELLRRLEGLGMELAFVTLHVGLDTFRPVQEEDPTRHTLHSEFYELPEETAVAIVRAKAEGRRVVCVGTTTVRVLEAAAAAAGDGGTDDAPVWARSGWTDLFVLPGHRFRVVDGLVTNFHLPRSTLLMLVCAFAGREAVLRAYAEAIERGYRFYSFGDAMLVV